jgi:hypothetical protein
MVRTSAHRSFDARGLAARVPDGMLPRVATLAGAGALLVAAAVHLAQLVSIFHAVPWIGPLFAADAVASTGIAIALLTTRLRVGAAAGALVSGGALLGLALSSTTGLLGWKEEILRPAVVVAIVSELVAVAALAPLALPAPPRPSARGPRALAAAGLLAVAVLHVVSATPEWDEARAIFWLFMALAAACAALSLRLAQGLDRWTWATVSALAILPFAGFLVSRTTGLPGDPGDIGDWANPVGLAALAVELALLPLAVMRLRIAPVSPCPTGPRAEVIAAPAALASPAGGRRATSAR